MLEADNLECLPQAFKLFRLSAQIPINLVAKNLDQKHDKRYDLKEANYIASCNDGMQKCIKRHHTKSTNNNKVF